MVYTTLKFWPIKAIAMFSWTKNKTGC